MSALDILQSLTKAVDLDKYGRGNRRSSVKKVDYALMMEDDEEKDRRKKSKNDKELNKEEEEDEEDDVDGWVADVIKLQEERVA